MGSYDLVLDAPRSGVAANQERITQSHKLNDHPSQAVNVLGCEIDFLECARRCDCFCRAPNGAKKKDKPVRSEDKNVVVSVTQRKEDDHVKRFADISIDWAVTV